MRTWIKLLIFVTPPAIVFGIPLLLLALGGELTPTETVLKKQEETSETVLYGTAFSNAIIPWKLKAIQERQPEILALGTSRVLQFREKFFNPDVTFYNGGSVVQRIQHLRQALELIPRDGQPRVLIVGVEQAWFNGNSAYSEVVEQGPEWFDSQVASSIDPINIWRSNWWKVWQRLAEGKLPIERMLSGRGLSDRIGFTAVAYCAGYRNNGSYKYRDYFLDISDPRHPDHDFSRGLRLIETSRIPFEKGQDLFQPSVKELKKFLKECRKRKIQVVGFLPPLPHVIVEKLHSEGEQYDYLGKLYPKLAPIFRKKGFEFYDFSDFKSLGAADSEAVDSFHGSERVYVRLSLSLVEKRSVLAAYFDAPVLRDALESEGNADLIHNR